jgi:hypothetical protein
MQAGTEEFKAASSVAEEIIGIFTEINGYLVNATEQDKKAINAYQGALLEEEVYLGNKYDHGKRAAQALREFVKAPLDENKRKKFEHEANHSGFRPRTKQAAWIALAVIIGVVVALATLAAIVFTSGKAAVALAAVDVWLGSVFAGGFAAYISSKFIPEYKPVLDAKEKGKPLLTLSIFKDVETPAATTPAATTTETAPTSSL